VIDFSLFGNSNKLSQDDIEKSSGLLRCYVSQIERAYSPECRDFGKLAHALKPYQLFWHEASDPADLKPLKFVSDSGDGLWDRSKQEAKEVARPRVYLSGMSHGRAEVAAGTY
jgi:transcriptional regulator with XRE-family HTH domain